MSQALQRQTKKKSGESSTSRLSFCSSPAHQAEPTHTSRWEKPTQVTPNPSKYSLAAASCSSVLSTTKQKDKTNQTNKQRAFLAATAPEELQGSVQTVRGCFLQPLHREGWDLSPCPAPAVLPQASQTCRNSLLGHPDMSQNSTAPPRHPCNPSPEGNGAQTSRSGFSWIRSAPATF